jgi:hypothetical protein
MTCSKQFVKKRKENIEDFIELMDNRKISGLTYTEVNAASYEVFGAKDSKVLVYPSRRKVVIDGISMTYPDIEILEQLLVNGMFSLDFTKFLN